MYLQNLALEVSGHPINTFGVRKSEYPKLMYIVSKNNGVSYIYRFLERNCPRCLQLESNKKFIYTFGTSRSKSSHFRTLNILSDTKNYDYKIFLILITHIIEENAFYQLSQWSRALVSHKVYTNCFQMCF